MSFITECLFCNTRVRVPDDAAGLSLPCPRCGNSFTVAAVQAPRAGPPSGLGMKPPARKDAPLADMGGPPTPAVLASGKGAGRAPTEPYFKPALKAEQLRPLLAPEPAEAVPPGARRPVAALGLASFFLAGVALLAVQVAALAFLAIPLAVAAFLVGVVGLAAESGACRGRWMAWGGVALGLAVPAGVLLVPHLLGINRDRETEAAPGAEKPRQLAVRLGKGKLEYHEVGESEWVDVSRYAVMHGGVRLEVTSVAVQPVEYRDGAGTKTSPTNYLVVGLRLINASSPRRIAHAGWATGAGVSLRDNQGQALAPPTAEGKEEIVGQVRQAVPLLVGKPVTDVLALAAPAGAPEYYHLELSASAFGETGTLRLRLPASLAADR